MRLAYFSPFNPQKSGIADYSEELLPHLSNGAEIDLFVEGFELENRELRARFAHFDYLSDPSVLARLDEYDAVLYHIGNDHRYHAGIYDTALKHPGIIVFHDFALHNFFVGLARERGQMSLYVSEIAACHGERAGAEAAAAVERGTLPWMAERPLDFPLNARLARSAEAIIVHSEWSRTRLARVAPLAPIARVNHHITAQAAAEEPPPRAAAGDTVQLASFGLITPDKGIERVLRALAALRASHDFHYTLVGATNRFFDVQQLIKEYGLAERVTITGHVSLEEFQRRMGETDLAINLRERTNGETSGSLCRIMAAGVAAVVSNVGWFSELPDDAVVKVDMDEYRDALLLAYLERLIADAPLRARLGANARRYVVAAHDIRRSAEGYLSFIREVAERRTRWRLTTSVAGEAARLGLRPEEDEALLRALAVEVAQIVPARISVEETTFRKNLAGVPLSPHNGNGDQSTRQALEKEPAQETRASAAVALPAVGGRGDERAMLSAAMDVEDQALKAKADEEKEDEPQMKDDADEGQAADEGRAAEPASALQSSETKPEASSVETGASSVEAGQSPVDGSTQAAGRLPKLEGLDYKRAAVEYPRKLDDERRHYLLTKPFYNLTNKPPKHTGLGMDPETHRHFCDFANMAVALALPPGSRLLDVGCGSGWLCEYFARLGYDVTGTDISPDLIEMAEERLRQISYQVDHRTPLRYRFFAHDIESAPLDETFDAVVCYDSLHHFVDERAVVRHLARMLEPGGVLFILEGNKPPAGSATEAELIGVMREYETLESPFAPEYLRELLVEHGFAIVSDFVSVNGLFDRDLLKSAPLSADVNAPILNYLPVWPEEVNYLLCKKVTADVARAEMADSRAPHLLRARIALLSPWPERARAGEELQAEVEIENTGDTLWLVGPAIRRGAVMPAVKLFDASGRLLRERHAAPPLQRPLAPGERVRVTIEETAPLAAGEYQVKIDLVAQHVAWFEQAGSEPLVLTFTVE